MKNVSDFKKRLVVGSKLHGTHHMESAGRNENGNGELVYKDKDLGVREVTIKQSNSFALKTQRTDGTFQDSWCDFPKASKCKILDENTIQLLEEDVRVREGVKPLIPILTYKFVD